MSTIKTTANGSLQVSGDVNIVDSQGNKFPTNPEQDVWLCRCGHSGTKPFCDGTHKKIGFQADDRASKE